VVRAANVTDEDYRISDGVAGCADDRICFGTVGSSRDTRVAIRDRVLKGC
jgi:hypothetical protein